MSIIIGYVIIIILKHTFSSSLLSGLIIRLCYCFVFKKNIAKKEIVVYRNHKLMVK